MRTSPLLPCLLLLASCKVGYVLRSGWYQAELLRSREPIEELVAEGALTPQQLEAVALIDDVRRWGEGIGLSATDNYQTIAWEWERSITVVTACDPLSFDARTWWFPVVGEVPYLGFFREEEATQLADRLDAQGLDVYVRGAGAYSTLGWFKDPVLPDMLEWSDFGLADTVLHELAHATLWVRGSVAFNESFANYVGEVAALRYLQQQRGPHDEGLVDAVHRRVDRETWRRVLNALFADLERVYEDPSLTDAQRQEAKARLLEEELPRRVREAGLLRPERYVAAAESGPWNNARMMQFRTYNTRHELFEALLVEEGGDLLAFIGRIEEITRRRRDPFVALEQAVGGG